MSTLRYRPYAGAAWVTSWCDPVSGDLLMDRRSDPIRLDPLERGAQDLLDYVALDLQASDKRRATVYLATGDSAATCPERDWYASAAADGWDVEIRMGSPSRRSAVCRRGDLRIDLRHTAAWFSGEHPLQRMRMAYGSLSRVLELEFGRDGDHVAMRGTPAQTGLALLDISLPRGTAKTPAPEFSPLSEASCELLTDTTFQHRRQLLTGRDTLRNGLTVYDGRMAYAAYLRDAPMGEPIATGAGQLIEHAAGWYHVELAAPLRWPHIGLAMRLSDRSWPGGGCWIDTWVSEPELRLIREKSWGVKILSGYAWPERTPDPLRAWGERLTDMYLRAARLPDRDMAGMLSGAIRRIILGAIGAFGRSHGVVSRVVPFGDAVNPGWIQSIGPWGYECEIPRPLSEDRMRYRQPQIAAHIYARQRANLARFALANAQPWEMLAVQTDAIVIDRYVGYAPQPEAKIGEYRVTGTLAGPLAAPQSWEMLAGMVRGAKATYGQLMPALYDPADERIEG